MIGKNEIKKCMKFVCFFTTLEIPHRHDVDFIKFSLPALHEMTKCEMDILHGATNIPLCETVSESIFKWIIL